MDSGFPAGPRGATGGLERGIRGREDREPGGTDLMERARDGFGLGQGIAGSAVQHEYPGMPLSGVDNIS